MALRQIQRCVSTEPYFVQEIPSESKPGVSYDVFSILPDDVPEEYSCQCPAYLFKGHCKHQNMAWHDRCHWTEEDEMAQKQTDDQRDRQICPRCGNETLKDVVQVD